MADSHLPYNLNSKSQPFINLILEKASNKVVGMRFFSTKVELEFSQYQKLVIENKPRYPFTLNLSSKLQLFINLILEKINNKVGKIEVFSTKVELELSQYQPES